jgi:hypothetical protein
MRLGKNLFKGCVMAIQSREQLATLLMELGVLSESQLNYMVHTAYFESTGLRGLFGRFLMDAPNSSTVIERFLTRAGYFAQGYGGDPAGTEMFPHYRPTGRQYPPHDPCEPLQWAWCFAPKGWKPPINRPFDFPRGSALR